MHGAWTGFPAVDIVRAGTDKSLALDWLARYLGIGSSRVWAFGDGMNDLGMLTWAGRGHAMGNASAEVKRHADVIVGSHDDHGVAEVIEAMLAE